MTRDTILAWHRRLVAAKWTYHRRTRGRLPLADEVFALIVKLARNDLKWGCSNIRDRLANLGRRVGRSTVASLVEEHGINPAPKRRRRTSWTTFMRAHCPSLAAIDFTTVEVWTKSGLVTCYVLFVVDLANRQAACAGITSHPEATWALQAGRNLTDAFCGFLREKR